MSEWNPEQYLLFKNERTQAAVDLVSRIALEPKSIIDIGICLLNKFTSL
jgi:trans-aconitate 2-methyltransferase